MNHFQSFAYNRVRTKTRVSHTSNYFLVNATCLKFRVSLIIIKKLNFKKDQIRTFSVMNFCYLELFYIYKFLIDLLID